MAGARDACSRCGSGTASSELDDPWPEASDEAELVAHDEDSAEAAELAGEDLNPETEAISTSYNTTGASAAEKTKVSFLRQARFFALYTLPWSKQL